MGRGDRHLRLRGRARRRARARALGDASATSCSSRAATSTRRGRTSRSTRTRRCGRAATTTAPQKAASERAAEAALPGRVAAVRAGLICGPHDNVFRLPWWVRRIAQGGRVPAPGDPGAHGPADRRARPRGLDARPRRAAGGRRLQRHGARRPHDDGRGAGGGGGGHRLGRRARLGARRAAAGGRRGAVDRAPAVAAGGRVPGHLGGRHRARAGVRPALPADRRDGRRRVGRGCATAARTSSTSGGPSTDLRR